MTAWKSNGVLTTRKRSGQVKPSNSIPSERRTSLRAPSAPISQRPDLVSVRPLRSIEISTPDGCCNDVSDLGIEVQLEIGLVAQLLVQDACQLGLLALHAIGMTRGIGDHAEIELGEHSVLLASILKRRRDETLRYQRLRGAEPIEHVERRWMKRRRARLLAEVAARLQHGHRHAAAHEVGRRHQTNRSGAGNQHAFFNRHGGSEVRCLRGSLFNQVPGAVYTNGNRKSYSFSPAIPKRCFRVSHQLTRRQCAGTPAGKRSKNRGLIMPVQPLPPLHCAAGRAA